MQRIFAMDGKVVNFLNKVADLVLLNILWLICCVPIVTIGASTTAFSYVLLKMVRDEESYLFSTFFRVFKENFKQSTVVWVIFILIGAVLYLDFYVVGIMTGGVKSILLTLFFMILFLVAATMFYVFPVMAFFENSTKKVFKNSFYMALAHLPYTLLIVVMVRTSVTAYVEKDLELARSVMKADDEIDQYFEEVRDEMIEFIREEKGENGKRIFDLIMVTKYLERIGDHATNIAEWVEFSITGVHKDHAIIHAE